MRLAVVILCLAVLSAPVHAGRNGTPYVAPTGTVSIPVSSQSNGAISVNNWTGFTSPAGTVFTASTWGATNTKYLEASDFHVMVAQTTATPRDVEITSYVRDGTFFLRLMNGTAIYCRHNAEAGTSGDFRIGVVTGLPGGGAVVDPDGALYGSYHDLYDNSDLGGTVPGYDRNNTSGATLTCGVSGFTIYAKFNGTTFASVKSNYAMAPGNVAVWANNGYGFRNVGASYLSTAPLYSMPSVSRFDPRDWGLAQGQTTGTITGGTNTLTLAASLGVAVGDSIIVAVGGESGVGARGTVGVGGNSPPLSFANATAMNADTGQPDGTYAWTRDNGQAFVSFSGVWGRGPFYYTEFTAPRSLLATVTQVNSGGLSLALDTNATTTATNAAVYINNYTPLDSLLNPAATLPVLPYQTIDIPAGTYQIGAPLGNNYFPSMLLVGKMGWRILGQGATTTVLSSPAGATSASLAVSSSTFTEIANIGIVGNNTANGFGLAWAGNVPIITEPRGIELASDSDNSVVHDFATTSVFQSGFAVAFGIDVTAYNCTITQTFAPVTGEIEPWYIQWADSIRGGASDCTFSSPTMITALETFRSNTTSFYRITLNNGSFSCNSCGGGFLVEDLTIIVGANVPGSFADTGPIVDVNSNIVPPSPEITQGGTFRRLTVIQQGYFNGMNVVLPAMNVNANNPNIIIEGTYPAANGKGCFQAPNWFSGTNDFDGVGVRNDGASTTVSGMRFIGQADYAGGKSNIYAESGAVTSTNNVMDHAVTGAGSITESGTQSNATWNGNNPGKLNCINFLLKRDFDPASNDDSPMWIEAAA